MFGDMTETGDLILADEDKSEVEKPTAVGRIEHVTKLVTQLLDQYDKEGKLTLHNDTIPQDEIWINVGGDHGGGSFKLRLQIANSANPNSKHNTCLLLIANLEDIPENTCKLLSLFNEQFTTLCNVVRILSATPNVMLLVSVKSKTVFQTDTLYSCLLSLVSLSLVSLSSLFLSGLLLSHTLLS